MPWSMPQSSPLTGCQSKPMVLRNPRANTVRRWPSGLMRSSAACSGFVSLQALQLDPTLR